MSYSAEAKEHGTQFTHVTSEYLGLLSPHKYVSVLEALLLKYRGLLCRLLQVTLDLSMLHHALYCSSNMSTLPSIFFLGSCLPGKYGLRHLSTCVPYSCRRKMLLFKRMQRPQVFTPEDGLLHHRLPAQGTWIPAQPKSQLLAYIYICIYISPKDLPGT